MDPTRLGRGAALIGRTLRDRLGVAEQAAALLFASFTAVMAMAGGAGLPGAAAAWCLAAASAIAYLIVAYGLEAAVLKRDRILAAPGALAAGFIIVNGAGTCASLIFKLPAAAPVAAAGLALFALALIALVRRPAVQPAHPGEPLFGMALLTVCLAALLFDFAGAADRMEQTGRLILWNDYLIHGYVVATFNSPFAGIEDLMLAGVDVSLYHYAPYVFPALIGAAAGLTPLHASIAILLPVGLLLAAFGALDLARCWLGGRAGAALCVAAVAVVPLARYPIDSPWTDFHLFTLITPGSGYGYAGAFIALLFLSRALSVTRLAPAVLGVGFAAALFLYRAHFFVLIFPVAVAAAGVVALRLRARARQAPRRLIAVLVVAAVITPPLIAHLFPEDLARHLSIFWRIHSTSETLGLDISGLANAPTPVQFAYIMISLFGPFLAVLIVMSSNNIVKETYRAKYIIGIIVFVAATWLIYFAPLYNYDPTEMRQRMMLLAYCVVALLSACAAVHFLYRMKLWPSDGLSGRVFFAAAIALLTGLGMGSDPVGRAAPMFGAIGTLRVYEMADGVFGAADYLRASLRRGDTIAGAGADLGARGGSGALVELSALTGARVFLGRPYSHAAGSREVAEIAAARLAFTEQVLRAPTWALAANDLRQAGVDWWVAATPESRPWDPEGAQAIHVSGDVFIYATQEGATVEVGQGDL